jgi:hypothetical protein
MMFTTEDPMPNREELIAAIRSELVKLTDEENSICRVAAARGIFCNGFNQYSDGELRQKFDWIVRKRPSLTRGQLEQIANDWQLAEQQVHERPIACDVQTEIHDICNGWDSFSNAQLEKLYFELAGAKLVVA